jgi:hypothetical protein
MKGDEPEDFPLQGKLQINPTSEVPALPAEGIELAIEDRVFVRFLGRARPRVILLRYLAEKPF